MHQNKESMVTSLVRTYGRKEILRLVKATPEHSKWCPRCEKAIDIDEFGPYHYCRPCYKIVQQEYRDLNPRRRRK